MIALITALFILLVAVVGFSFTESAIANADGTSESDESSGIEAPIVEGTEVVKIVNNKNEVAFYDTFSEAIAELQDGDTLTVLRDFSISEDVDISADITFDLNGNTVSAPSLGIYLNFDGKTTINDSSAEGTGTTEYITFWLGNKDECAEGEFNNFIQSGYFNGHVVVGSNTLVKGGTFNGGILANDGENIEIAGGTFNHPEDSDNCLTIWSKNIITISGGKFNGKCSLGVDKTNIYVTGGEFNLFIDIPPYFDASEIQIQISGGTFEKLSTGTDFDCADFLKEGCAYQNVTTGDYIALADAEKVNTMTKVKVVECSSHEAAEGSNLCKYCGKCAHASVTDLVCDGCNTEIAASIVRDEATLYFISLEDAFKAVKSGETVTLERKINYANLNSTAHESIEDCTAVHVTTNCTLEYKEGCYLNTGNGFYTLIVDEGVSFVFNDQSGQSLDLTKNRAKIKNNGNFTVSANSEFFECLDNYGTIKGGMFHYQDEENAMVTNYGTIEDGTFSVVVDNYGTIGALDGTSNMDIDTVDNKGVIYEGNIMNAVNYGTIAGGTYNNQVTNNGTITNGTFSIAVTNNGKISGGSYTSVTNMTDGTISGGTFTGQVTNNGTIGSSDGTANPSFKVGIENNATILSGTFTSAANSASGTISGGTFSGEVANNGVVTDGTFSVAVTNNGTISGGTFNGIVQNSAIVTGGTFVKLKIDSDQDSADCYVCGGTFTGYNGDPLTPHIELFSSSSSTPTLPSTGGISSLPTAGTENNLVLGKYLANGYAFYNISDNSLYEDAYVGAGLYDVYVASHTHSFDEGKCKCGYECYHEGLWENGVCSNCGYHCKHSDLSENYCNVCESTLCVKIVDDEDNTTYYCTVDDALAALQDGDTLTLLADASISVEKRITKSVTIDLNGHTLSGDGSLYFLDNGNGEVILKNSNAVTGGKFDVIIESWTVKLTIQNGNYGKDIYADCELTIESGSFSGNIHVQSDKTCTISSGIFATINLQNSAATIESDVINTLVVGGESRQISVTVNAVVTTMILKATAYSVKLNGGGYGSIDLSASSLSYADLLAEGYAFTNESGFIPLASITSTTEVYVNAHSDKEHGWSDGVCVYCSKVCAHPSWNDEYKCAVCGEDCVHEHWTNGVCDACSKVCTHEGGTATCITQATCAICGELYGDLDENNHTGEETWNVKTATDHAKEWNCCHKTIVSIEAHDWENGTCEVCGKVCAHDGGNSIEATCSTQATCAICGELYGDLDENNHTGEETWNVKTATDHAKEWNCCHKTIVSIEAHDWENGVCTECDYHCVHAWTAGICDMCGKVCSHEGGHATCNDFAVCDVCGYPYGDFNLDEHHLVLQQAVAATTTERGRITFYLCEDCGRCFTDVLGAHEIEYEDTFTSMLPPSIVEGADGEYVRESGSGLVFKSNADGKDFIGVSVDGIVIGEENYERLDGGLIIGLKTEYLETLSNGNHTLSIVSAGGEATTGFTVEAVPEEGLSGGAWAGIGIAIATAVIGAMMGIMFIFKKLG